MLHDESRTTESGTVADRLRANGLRVTASRLAVLRAVSGHPHLDADGIAEVARRQLGSLSTQAVYDNLHALGRAGLLRRIEPAGGPARYEDRVGDNHHHVVCRACGTTCDVDCAVGFAPCLEASDTHGYRVDEAEVTFWGMCPACLAGAGARASAEPLRAPLRAPPTSAARTRGEA